MDNRIEKLRGLLDDEAFVKELFAKDTPEEAQAFFKSKGADITLEEVKSLGETIGKLVNGEISAEDLVAAASGELSEAELENAAGGEVIGAVATGLIIFGTSVIATGSVAAGVTACVKYADEIGEWFRSW